MKNEEELAGRIGNLEKTVECLLKDMQEIKSTNNSILEELRSLKDEIEVETPSSWDSEDSQLTANVWAQNAFPHVFKAMRTLPSEFPKETFGPTISALREKEKGATASDIGEITGRKRNTESFYLKRLYMAGIVRRQVKNRKVFYILTDDKKIIAKFSYLFS